MTTFLVLVALLAVGAATGVLAGILGVGGGIFLVPFLVLALGMTQHEAEATSLLVIVPTALVASLTLRRAGVGDLGSERSAASPARCWRLRSRARCCVWCSPCCWRWWGPGSSATRS
jgi:hypothetical protein